VRILGLALWLASAASAGEYVLLASGAALYADRHELLGDLVRLHRGEGFIELPLALVIGFEPAPVLSRPAGEVPLAQRPSSTEPPEQLIERAAARYGGADFAALLHSVARVESGYRPDAVSPKGARGLLQLMPETARQLEADPDDPAQNADAGARFLRELLLKYRDHPYQLRLALAAYNAGPGAVERYGGVPPYPETTRYVERVLEEFRRLRVNSTSSRAR
jgi:soluble lytic murein transglycosylase-like protein